jgi:hypothetical protein
MSISTWLITGASSALGYAALHTPSPQGVNLGPRPVAPACSSRQQGPGSGHESAGPVDGDYVPQAVVMRYRLLHRLRPKTLGLCWSC